MFVQQHRLKIELLCSVACSDAIPKTWGIKKKKYYFKKCFHRKWGKSQIYEIHIQTDSHPYKLCTVMLVCGFQILYTFRDSEASAFHNIQWLRLGLLLFLKKTLLHISLNLVRICEEICKRFTNTYNSRILLHFLISDTYTTIVLRILTVAIYLFYLGKSQSHHQTRRNNSQIFTITKYLKYLNREYYNISFSYMRYLHRCYPDS